MQRRGFFRRHTPDQPYARTRFSTAFQGYQASHRTDAGRHRRRGRAELRHSTANPDWEGPPWCPSRLPRGSRTLPSVQIRKTTEKPYTGLRSRREKTQAKPSMAVAKGFGTTVSSRLRSPRSPTNNGRQARSRRGCPDPSAGRMLGKRSCYTVCQASAKATHVADGREYRQAVSESHTSGGIACPPS